MRRSIWGFILLVVILTSVGVALAHFSSRSMQHPQMETQHPDPSANLTKSLPPTPIVMHRVGPSEVNIVMTAQPTTVEIDHGTFYHAWTFNGSVPAPVLKVKQGDVLHITLKNLDENMPHSLDLHAVQAAPDKNFSSILPGKDGTFTYVADTPGVFMYHCGTPPVLLHVANGMYGMMIVEPKNGYPIDAKIKQTYTIVQSEWYKENDLQDMRNGNPQYVVFNGSTFSLIDHPLQARVGETIRFYVVNAGPNHVSALHIVGTQFNTVYLNGNPRNPEYDMQTVLIPPGGSAVVETACAQPGTYMIMTHQLNDADKGAMGYLTVAGK